MGFKNLGEFLKALRDAGELVEVKAPVDPVLEVTEIYDRVVKKEGPALLFTNVRGSSVPLAINLFGSAKRMSMACTSRAWPAIVRLLMGSKTRELGLNESTYWWTRKR